MPNIVYIATSLDGYIADRNGSLEFLSMVPVPEGDDLGFAAFMDRIDALVMGRATYETVVGFGVPWPYPKPVFVLTSSGVEIPPPLRDKVEAIRGSVDEVVSTVTSRGYATLYVDGGRVIQSFLAEDRIDEMVLTRMPILLGGGTPLFAVLPGHLEFEHASTEVLAGELVQSRYVRKRG